MKTFIEWLIDTESDFVEMTKEDVIDNIKDIHNYLLSEGDTPDTGRHYGDCTKQNITCLICLYQNWLDEYEKYCRENYLK